MNCNLKPYHNTLSLVGDPVDVITGANLDRQPDLELPGPLPFQWYRHYDSSQSQRHGVLGWGHTHHYDHRLLFDLDGFSYTKPAGEVFYFPALTREGDSVVQAGVLLRRLTSDRYEIQERGEPLLTFQFYHLQSPARLIRVSQGEAAIQFGYERGYLTNVTDSLGRSIYFEYDKVGHLIRLVLVKWAENRKLVLLTYTYDSAGNLIAGKDVYGHTFRFKYDHLNRLIARTDKRGHTFRFEYDQSGRCVHSYGENGLHEVRINYLPVGKVTLVTKADGGQWTYRYDESGVVTEIIDPYGGLQKFIVDGEGRVIEEVDPNGNKTKWVYNTSGTLIGTICPLGYFRSFPEDQDAIDPLEHLVPQTPLEWEYGRLWAAEEIKLPVAASPVFSQLPFAEAAQWIKTVTYPAEPPGKIYSEGGRLIKEIDSNGYVEQWTYDPNGNIKTYCDRDGSIYTYEYISWNLLAREINPLGHLEHYEYTRSEEVAAVVDAGGTRSEYRYDLKDRLIEVRRHGVVKETYHYDKADNLIEKRDGTGRTLVSFKVGTANLDSVCQLASGGNYYFEYDEQGRFTKVATDEFAVSFAYDEDGRQIQDQWDNLGVKHVFDDRELIETTVFERFTTVYQHDEEELGRLLIQGPGEQTHTLQWLENGLVLKTLSNGTSELSQYDGDGRCLLKIVSNNLVSRPPWIRRYSYSKVGDLLTIEDNQRGQSRYTYDVAHRLIRAELPQGRSQTLVYDNAGNLLQQFGLKEVVLREGNRLLSANGEVFEYNHRNHISSRRNDKDAIQYLYDADDMLVQCVLRGDEWKAQYDPLGRRVYKIFQGQRLDFYWDTDRLVAEVWQTTGKVRIYVYANEFALTPFMFVEYDSIEAAPQTGKRYFIFSDHLGTPIQVEDEAGEIVWQAQILPYGIAEVEMGQSFHLPLRFPGHYFDAETRLHYNRFRYYDPQLGRYLQSDPQGIGGGLNLYAYGEGNPLTEVDVDGLGCGGGKKGKKKRNKTKPKREHTQSKSKVKKQQSKPGQQSRQNNNRGWGKGQIPCFPANEVVSTPLGLRPIETINIGDEVYTLNQEDGTIEIHQVTDVFVGYTYCWVEITTANSQRIRSTRTHPFWVDSEQRWLDAEKLTHGMELLKIDGSLERIETVNFRCLSEPDITFNLAVESFSNFFVGQLTALVHNATSLDQPGHYNYKLVYKSGPNKGEVFYHGRFGPNESRDSVVARHKRTGRFSPNDTKIVVDKGTRTYAEARRKEHERIVNDGTLNRNNPRANQINGMSPKKFKKYYQPNAC